jgi:hypothetical protein
MLSSVEVAESEERNRDVTVTSSGGFKPWFSA